MNRLQSRSSIFYAFLLIMMLLGFTLTSSSAFAQNPSPTAIPEDTPPEAPGRVDVQPIARDEQISTRLEGILSATGWFVRPRVRVQDGVVFLSGQAQSAEFKTWAGDLARNTQDVAAVVNQLEVIQPPFLDFQPFINGLQEQTRIIVRSIPLLGFSLIILFVAWIIARQITSLVYRYFQGQELNALLQNVIARAIGIIVFLGGLYLVFQISGLTSIAFTIIGGTGLLGLILGIAFRDITENFLASIFLSAQNPFKTGDLIEIDAVVGFVQRMNIRTTVLMTPAGNHVEIPNATVYKSIIHNYTSNPNRRIDFTLGIGYDDSISLAQETIVRVLNEHPAILSEPEHLVLVDSLGNATVKLQIYFWINGTQYSWPKVKSSVIRLVKHAIQEAGISMPDEAREVIFPQGIPVTMINQKTDQRVTSVYPPIESETFSTNAEGGLVSEVEEIEIQARQSRPSDSSENLLQAKPSEPETDRS